MLLLLSLTTVAQLLNFLGCCGGGNDSGGSSSSASSRQFSADSKSIRSDVESPPDGYLTMCWPANGRERKRPSSFRRNRTVPVYDAVPRFLNLRTETEIRPGTIVLRYTPYRVRYPKPCGYDFAPGASIQFYTPYFEVCKHVLHRLVGYLEIFAPRAHVSLPPLHSARLCPSPEHDIDQYARYGLQVWVDIPSAFRNDLFLNVPSMSTKRYYPSASQETIMFFFTSPECVSVHLESLRVYREEVNWLMP